MDCFECHATVPVPAPKNGVAGDPHGGLVRDAVALSGSVLHPEGPEEGNRP